MAADSLPLPLTTKNLRPRSQARRPSTTTSSSSKSSSSRSDLTLGMSSSGEGSGSRSRSSPRGVKRTNAAVVPRKRQKIEESDDDIEEFPDNLTQATPPPTTQTQSTLKDEEIEELSSAGPAPKSPKLETEPIAISDSSSLASSSKLPPAPPPPPQRLSEYSCPICFCAPTNATMTPCGHVCCGSCLFTAIKTMIQRGAMTPGSGEARCPVCRAEIPGWDGRGGGRISHALNLVLSSKHYNYLVE
uniref:RING-type domain-containing protein n=1 Tax=Mycena chlorophos TaxID=658473 RepID=A0ABQ0L7H9_MYCCL|nr:predicted protein [Mycena chlorophos]